MTTIIVSFNSEQEAQAAIARLSQANLGEVHARLLDSSEPVSYSKSETNTPMVTPDGTMEVRPADNPQVPEARVEDIHKDASASIPTTGQQPQGVQVMIEMDEASEETVRRILSASSGESGEQVGE